MHWFVYCLALYNLLARCCANTTDFCAFKCGKDHIVCKRQPCSGTMACGKKYKMLLPNDEVRQWILDIHNEFRDQVSSNASNVVNGSTGAKNMAILSYSKEIEFVAQCWANSCKAEGSHDKCRTTSRFDYVGQNVYNQWISAMTWDLTYDNLKSGIQAWFDECKGATVKDIGCFGSEGSSKAIGHFTQLAWAETTHVGCGITKFGSSEGLSWILVCDYGTGGNILTTPVYKEGTPPCSECKNNAKCNAKYPTLCGESESLAMDTWRAPYAMGGEKVSGSAMAVCLLVVMAIFHHQTAPSQTRF